MRLVYRRAIDPVVPAENVTRRARSVVFRFASCDITCRSIDRGGNSCIREAFLPNNWSPMLISDGVLVLSTDHWRRTLRTKKLPETSADVRELTMMRFPC